MSKFKVGDLVVLIEDGLQIKNSNGRKATIEGYNTGVVVDSDGEICVRLQSIDGLKTHAIDPYLTRVHKDGIVLLEDYKEDISSPSAP